MASAGDGLRRLAERAERFERQWPDEGAAALSRAVSSALMSDTGDGSLSHGKGMGRASVRTVRHGSSARVQADGSARVWGILQKGTRAHDVVAAPGRFLATPQGPRRRVRVGGSRPRQTWTRGVRAGMPDVQASARSAVRAVIG